MQVVDEECIEMDAVWSENKRKCLKGFTVLVSSFRRGFLALLAAGEWQCGSSKGQCGGSQWQWVFPVAVWGFLAGELYW